MKKKELIALLENIPEDMDIVVQGYSCDIMGEYMFESDFQIIYDYAMKTNTGGLYDTISNGIPSDAVEIEVILLS